MEIPYSTFLSYLDQGQVSSVKILDGNEIYGTLSSQSEGNISTFKTRIPYYDDLLMKDLRDKGVKVTGAPKPVSVGEIILQLLPWLLFLFFFWFMFRQVQGGGVKHFLLERVKQNSTPMKRKNSIR